MGIQDCRHHRPNAFEFQRRRREASRRPRHQAQLERDRHRWEGAVVMTEHTAEQVRQKVDAVYRSESRRIFATLIRLLGDLELAEDALHVAFSAALERWPKEGGPANPRAWLVSAGPFRCHDPKPLAGPEP